MPLTERGILSPRCLASSTTHPLRGMMAASGPVDKASASLQHVHQLFHLPRAELRDQAPQEADRLHVVQCPRGRGGSRAARAALLAALLANLELVVRDDLRRQLLAVLR